MKEDGLQVSRSWRFHLWILSDSHLIFLQNPCLKKEERSEKSKPYANSNLSQIQNSLNTTKNGVVANHWIIVSSSRKSPVINIWS